MQRPRLPDWHFVHTPVAGQGVVEYGLILSLSALLAAILLVAFGGTLSAFLQAVGDAIDAAT
jgi:Flp pilus assembly pilin Flp